MGPSEFVHKVLVSSIAFTVIAAAMMMGIAYVGYSTDVVHSNLRRILTSGLLIVCLIGAVAAVIIFFPHQIALVIDTLSALASSR
jgi:hypothetical protein